MPIVPEIFVVVQTTCTGLPADSPVEINDDKSIGFGRKRLKRKLSAVLRTLLAFAGQNRRVRLFLKGGPTSKSPSLPLVGPDANDL